MTSRPRCSRASNSGLIVLIALLVGTLDACRSSSGGGDHSAGGAPTSPRSSSSTPAAARPSTVVHTLVPSAAAVSGTRTGNCFTTSITVGSADAYRCFAGNAILDPCYGSGRTVTCYADPWSKPVSLRLTQPLPGGPAMTVHRPWAIQLAGGIRCIAATGVVPVVDHVPLTYTCLDGGAAALTGSATAPLRTASYRPTTTAPLRPLTVTDVWNG
ncbi:MAG: hypothetical protein ACTHMS_11160 [Jatrophihabitans sp.]|uniref:hypothetical protein n=1 Tax=Jatrophihabitans sp. TaxID=1932789 RepID=UPI003F816FE5